MRITEIPTFLNAPKTRSETPGTPNIPPLIPMKYEKLENRKTPIAIANLLHSTEQGFR